MILKKWLFLYFLNRCFKSNRFIQLDFHCKGCHVLWTWFNPILPRGCVRHHPWGFLPITKIIQPNLVTFLKIYRNLLKGKSLSADPLLLPWQHFLGGALQTETDTKIWLSLKSCNRRLPNCVLKSRSRKTNPIGVQLIKVIIFVSINFNKLSCVVKVTITYGRCKTPVRGRGRQFNRIDFISGKVNFNDLKSDICNEIDQII